MKNNIKEFNDWHDLTDIQKNWIREYKTWCKATCNITYKGYILKDLYNKILNSGITYNNFQKWL